MENAQNFAAIVSSMVLGPYFFDHFSMCSQIPFFFIFFHVPIFQFVQCFPIFGVGEGDVFPKYGVGGCFPIFRDGGRGVFCPILGLGGGFGGLGGLGGGPPPLGPISLLRLY